MKRSGAVTLVLMGTTAFGLSACDRAPEAYANVDGCITAKRHTEAECRDGFATAQREHALAQHFSTHEECAQRYGFDGCDRQTAADGATIFVPEMLGFMFAVNSGFHPLYRDPRHEDGYLSSSGFAFRGYSGGGGYVGGWFGRGYSFARSEVGSVTRGGFGGIGRSFSGGG